jgi:hypothetical protein
MLLKANQFKELTDRPNTNRLDVSNVIIEQTDIVRIVVIGKIDHPISVILRIVLSQISQSKSSVRPSTP